ncbi:MAG: DUF4435 domain-containing protein, partial [Bacteroidaceae bacterium]|nr:DUF4435 domain-containing protein [Bacteroidaceae bacterium]
IAYVESYDDIFFWRSVLSDFENDERYFEVMLPSQNTLSKGKKQVLMNALCDRLGSNMIACVDADYDYLLGDTTPTSREVNNNPFILHTYVYSIENYQCMAESLHNVCVMATLNDRHIIDFAAFMHAFSEIVFPLFVWSVWAYRYNRYRVFSLTDFCEAVKIEAFNIAHPEHSLEKIRRNVNRRIGWLQRKLPEARKTYEPLRHEILQLGVTPETTYLYIQGHHLLDNVVSPILDPVCKLLRREREKEIKALAEHDVQMQNELSCYQHSSSAIDQMLRKNTNFKNSEPYERLRRDINDFLNKSKYNDYYYR